MSYSNYNEEPFSNDEEPSNYNEEHSTYVRNRNDYTYDELERAIQASLQQYQLDSNRQSPNICFQYMVKPMSCIDESNKHIYESINQTSDKILLPLALLNTIYPGRFDNLSGNIEDIVIFEINILGLTKITYGTPYQYIDSDCIYLPDGMFRYLNADYNSICNFNLVNNVKKGKEVLLKPQNKEFINIRDQQELLFEEFNNQFRLLYINQQITIYSKEIDKNIDFIVDAITADDEAVDDEAADNEATLELIKIYDVDLIVNFELPDNIVDALKREEEEKKQAKLMQEASIRNTQPIRNKFQNVQQESEFVSFSGKGNSLLSNNVDSVNATNNIITPENQSDRQVASDQDNNLVNKEEKASKIDINKLREQRLKFFRN